MEFLKVPPFSYVVCNDFIIMYILQYNHACMYNRVYSLILCLAITTVQVFAIPLIMGIV